MNGKCNECTYQIIRPYSLPNLPNTVYESPACCAPRGVHRLCLKIKGEYTTLPVLVNHNMKNVEIVSFVRDRFS